MPYQFGLLTGTVTKDTRFDLRDHRSFRLAPALLDVAVPVLEREVWPVAEGAGLSKAALALAFCASVPGVCTIIPGVRTPAQADATAARPCACRSTCATACGICSTPGRWRTCWRPFSGRGD